jgi:hypothetical protein
MCLRYTGGGIGHRKQDDTNAAAANHNRESVPDEDIEHDDEYGTEAAVGVQPDTSGINPDLDDDGVVEADNSEAEDSDMDSEHDSDDLDDELEGSGDEDDFGPEDDLGDEEDYGFDAL